MMATADTTAIIIVKNSVRQRYFSPPWGGFCSLGIFGLVLVFTSRYVFPQRDNLIFSWFISDLVYILEGVSFLL
jgi:hypothetical protein